MAAKASAHRLFVVGGTGFVGQAVCHSALARGWEVVSLSRHGAPDRSTIVSRTNNNTSGGVQWVRGDALKPETYKDHLSGCTAVVHSVGVLMENSYKKLVSIGSSGGAVSSQEAATYEKANRDTALSVARAAREVSGIDAFVYMSASDVLPFLDSRYISTKREAENDLIEHRDQMRPVILRPGFIFSPSRPITMPIAAGVKAFNTVFHQTPLGCVLKYTPFAKAASPALRREVLANAIINAIEDPKVSGILNIADIESLGNRH
ncbi:hypothetical protein LPJ64_000090 [Coemansia asiatica]|uniref:NAD(P)-binding domain-containing protein n=1 Tax=Coemansia asiatica TaxID=1052880 RepID=A0A9W7XSK4_9FUNG|nr:hypothetical protein LPJ64_000090 [Coemansia asiatica]